MARKQPEKKSTDKKSTKKTASAAKSKKAVSKKDDDEILDQDEELEEEDEEEDDSPDDESISAKTDDSEEFSDDDVEEEGDELEQDPLVKKLIDYASSKQIISWDEITEILTPEFVNSPKMESVLQLLTKNNIQVMEEDDLLDEDEDDSDDEDDVENEEDISDEDGKDGDLNKHRLVANDKDSGIDDPIRLYLREIGKENLLTAEQEVTLSKQMEDGLNIIKKVISNSGMIIPEFYTICHTIYKKIDPHEPGKARKEINELMAERRRLRSCYVEYVKPIREQMSDYMSLKKQLHTEDPSMNIFNDENLIRLKAPIKESIASVELQTEEIEAFSNKFIVASKQIDEYHTIQDRRMKKLRISDAVGLRSIGRRLAIRTESVKLEKELGMTADEIRSDYTEIQKIDRKLRELEYDFENSVDEIIEMKQ